MYYDYRTIFPSSMYIKVPIEGGAYITGINFDNAATTPAFRSVLNSIIKFSPYYSSIHRGMGYKSQICSEIYEEARNIILDFFQASREKYTVIFVKNTTEGINKLAYRLNNSEENIILSSYMEHHSNDLPWRDKWKIDYIDIDGDGRLSIESLKNKLFYYNGKVKYVTITGASNVTGYVNDIHSIARICHSYGAKLIVDGAQLVPHKNVKIGGSLDDDIDYLVFSAHKMYAPFGIGVIIAPKESFRSGGPEYKGGGTVKFVSTKEVLWEDAPSKEEAGTPNLIGVIALMTAIKQIKKLGINFMEQRERELTKYALDRLNKKDYIEIYGSRELAKDRLGIITFNIKGVHHSVVADRLSKDYGIEVRNGCFCAQPYVQRLLGIKDEEIEVYKNNSSLQRPGMVRISFGIYNTEEEIDRFIKAIEDIYYKSLGSNF